MITNGKVNRQNLAQRNYRILVAVFRIQPTQIDQFLDVTDLHAGLDLFRVQSIDNVITFAESQRAEFGQPLLLRRFGQLLHLAGIALP